MKTVCNPEKCTGCGTCSCGCPVSAIAIANRIRDFSAVINEEKCIGCGKCKEVCAQINEAEKKEPVYFKQGWAKKEAIRKKSTSGGVAAAITKAFIEDGGYVASCIYEKGKFIYKIVNDLETARRFAGSKYVKSDPGSIYKEIKDLLKKNEKVLFIGLPCHCAALKKAAGEDKKLYTADILCHGTPSAWLLRKYLLENGIDIYKVKNITFRDGIYYGITCDGNRLSPKRSMDPYTIAFTGGIDFPLSCYDCGYADSKRVSDITLGDAWGQMSDNEPMGVSYIQCQTQKGISLVESSGLHLENVDEKRVKEANEALRKCAEKTEAVDYFFEMIEQGKSFSSCVKRAMPKMYRKQKIKTVLIRTGIMKDRA